MAKGDWTKFYSDAIQQECAYDKKSGWLFTRDGAKYSPTELALIVRSGNDCPVQVHIIKKMFEGTVVDAPAAIPGRENLKFGEN